MMTTTAERTGHHAGRLQAELIKMGRYPLLVIDLCRHRNYAEHEQVTASFA